MKEMIKKLQRKSNKKGFTLVEIIVVLVILAILTAIAVPAVLGYINDAKDSKYVQEARSIYIVVQTEEAKVRAEANNKDLVLTQDQYDTIAGTAATKTGLTSVAITKPDSNGKYVFTWTSDGKTITANLTKNSDVKITHS